MADVEKVVKILFNAEDNITGTLKKIDQGFSGVGDFAAPFAKLGDAILKVEGAVSLLAGATIGFAAIKFAEFETASTSLTKILKDDLKPQVEGLEKEIIDFSNETGVASSTLLNTATDFKRAGAEFEDLNRLTSDSVKLFAAAAEAEFELGDATTAIVRTIKGFNLDFSESGRVIDTVNILSNEYATSAGFLAEALGRLSPVADKLGLSIEETGAFLTPVIEVFQSGEIAAAALNTSFLKILDDSAPVQEALGKLGVNQRDANGQFRKGKDILFDLAEAFKTADENEKLLITSQLVGIRQAAKFITVIDRWGQAQEAVNVAIGGTGSATRELEARLKDTQKQFDRVATSFENVFVLLGKEIKLASASSASAIADLFISIQKGITAGSFDPLIKSVSDVGDKMAEIFSSVAKNIPAAFDDIDFSVLIGSFEDLQSSVSEILSALFGDVDITTVTGLTEAIQNVVDAVTLVNNVTAGIIDVWTPIIGLFADVTNAFGDMSEETQKSLGAFLGWSQVVVAGTAGISAFAVALIGATKAIGGGLSIVKSLSAAFSGPAGLVAAAGAAGVALGTLARKIPGIDDAAQKVIETTDKFFNLGLGTAPTEEKLKAINTAFEEAKEQNKALTESQKEFNEAVEAAPKEPLPAKYKQGLKDFDNDLVDATNKIFELAAAGKEIPEDLFDIRMTFVDQEELDGQIKSIETLRLIAEQTQEVFDKDTELDIIVNAASVTEAEQKLLELAKDRAAIVRANVNEESLAAAQKRIEEAEKTFDADVIIKAIEDKESLEKTLDFVETSVGGVRAFVSVGTAVDRDSKEKTLKELSEELPTEKKIKVALELEKQKIERELGKLEILAETAQAKFEWQAKLDIAEVEAEAQKAVALSETLTSAFAASGDVISSALGALTGDLDFTTFNLIKQQLEFQNEIQERSLELTERKIALEERLAAAKEKRLLSGEPLVTISTEGLQPAAEALILELAEFFQVQASLEGAEALLGL